MDARCSDMHCFWAPTQALKPSTKLTKYLMVQLHKFSIRWRVASKRQLDISYLEKIFNWTKFLNGNEFYRWLQIWTEKSWVGITNATSVLSHPPFLENKVIRITQVQPRASYFRHITWISLHGFRMKQPCWIINKNIKKFKKILYFLVYYLLINPTN